MNNSQSRKPNGDKVTAVSVTSISILDADDHPLKVNKIDNDHDLMYMLYN